MDALSDPEIHTVVLVASAQVGKTETLNNIIGYYITQDPCPILVVQPTLEMGQEWSKGRLAPMLRDTPILQGLVSDPRARMSDNTILRKQFPGGSLAICGANSPAGLASRPIRVVLCDEIDRYPPSAGTEGDPVNLAWKRAAAFWNRKRLLVSTPTLTPDPVSGVGSRIMVAYEHSDQRQFWVPCPACGEEQVLRWPQVTWPKGAPHEAIYTCEHCGAIWDDVSRHAAVRLGHWRATTECHGVAGFRIWEGYSPFSRLGDMAAAFLEAKKMPETLKTFINTVLGETWDDNAERVDCGPLMERAEDWGEHLPDGVLLLTAGVDTQDDRLECEVTGWGLDYETWSVDYAVFYGDPNRRNVWNQLRDYLLRKWTRADGRTETITAAGVDTGGHCTDAVYRFCLDHWRERVFAIRGNPNPGRPLVGRPGRRNRAAVKVYPVNVDAAKELIYSRLQIDSPGPGYCHFPLGRDREYYEQLTAERRTVQFVRGRQRLVWRQTRRRNEALDCRVYALAAYVILRPSMPAIAKRLAKSLSPLKPPKPPMATETQPPALNDETFPASRSRTKKKPGGRGSWVMGW